MNAGEVFLCENNGGVMKNGKVSKTNWSPGHETWTTTPSPCSMNSVSPPSKELPTNTSLDSGVAGLRDTPVHTAWRAPQETPVPAKVHSDDPEIPKFIVDPTTRTTYLRGKFLGKGGFARVHELTDLTNDKTYAGKIIPKSKITKPRHKEKIAREIDVHEHLRHKHVVRFHHYFEDSLNVYIILEYCSRRSLVHMLKRRKRVREPEAQYYMKQLVEGVAYIHREKIVHRDLKLGNMFLTEDMIIKIGDFGLATPANDIRKSTVCGTPNYLAPEVLSLHGHSYAADIWAMGCIMYALLVGHPPFETDTLDKTYHRIAHNKYTIPAHLSCSARSLIKKLLHKDPCSRPSLDAISTHQFFTHGYMPRSLPASACVVEPDFKAETMNTSPPESPGDPPLSNEQLKRITSSVSTLKIVNTHKMDNSNKISILDNGLDGRKVPKVSARDDQLKKPIAPTFSSALRQKLTSVICTADTKSKLVSAKRLPHKEMSPGQLYNMLANCLDSMPDVVGANPAPISISPVFISKWIDYSNKYGFGYQLSDHSVGVFFNDTSLVTTATDRSWVEFHDALGIVTTHEEQSIPVWLEEKHKLLQYFSTYMGEYLIDAAETRPQLPHLAKTECLPRMRRWDRTHNSIIMLLDTGTFQVNFFKDHSKLAFAKDGAEVVVMFINCERVSRTYRLVDLSLHGCDQVLRERLIYALSCLRQYADLEADGL